MIPLFRQQAVDRQRKSGLGSVSRLKLPKLRGPAERVVPVWLQSEAAECGLACLAMVAGSFGHRTDLASLRQRFPVSLRGSTLADLVRVGAALGLQTRPMRAELEDLPLLQTPCILHWEMNHFVVLVGVFDGVATIHDPARGRRQVAADELSGSFTGVALELQPDAHFAQQEAPPRVTLRQLLGRLPVAWFESRQAGDVWSRFSAVQHTQRTLTTHFVEAVLDGLMVLLTLGVMLYYSGRLAAVALLAVAAYAALRRAFFVPQREATEQMLVHEARQSSHFLESLLGMQAIKLFNAQALRGARFSSLVVDALNADVAVRRLQIRAAVLHRVLFGLERVAVVWLGALLVMGGALTLGMLFAFVAFKELFTQRISALIDKVVELKMLRLHVDRVADILLAKAEPLPGVEFTAAGGEAAAAVELRAVRFRRGEGDDDVLHGLSLRIDAGECVAIVGPSGCGKSTLVKLILGIYQAQSGEVLVQGVPLRPAGLSDWRAKVGAVMQDEPLFAGTVADNIAFFDLQPERAWLERCAVVAGIHDEIMAMPMGYQTLVGEAGVALSGGQKQRVLLARALYKRPAVLVLDEATSALDVEGERRVNQAVRNLAMTRIIVAHRPETVASADRVIALRKGRIGPDLRSVRSQEPAA